MEEASSGWEVSSGWGGAGGAGGAGGGGCAAGCAGCGACSPLPPAWMRARAAALCALARTAHAARTLCTQPPPAIAHTYSQVNRNTSTVNLTYLQTIPASIPTPAQSLIILRTVSYGAVKLPVELKNTNSKNIDTA